MENPTRTLSAGFEGKIYNQIIFVLRSFFGRFNRSAERKWKERCNHCWTSFRMLHRFPGIVLFQFNHGVGPLA